MPHTGNYQVTTNEIMDYLKENMVTRYEFNEFKENVNERFERIDERFERIDERFERIDERFEKTDKRIGKLQSDMIDHIDRQLLALRGDLVVIMRGQDRKLGALIDLLAMKRVITQTEARSIISMEPFPQVS